MIDLGDDWALCTINPPCGWAFSFHHKTCPYDTGIVDKVNSGGNFVCGHCGTDFNSKLRRKAYFILNKPEFLRYV